MNGNRTVVRNALWNWAGMATHMLVGFLIAPFLVTHLGDSTYGLWIVIASLTSYFGVLDLGIGGSVGRNVAFFKARNDLAGVNGILSTAVFYLCSVAVLSLLATVAAVFVFFVLVDVQPDQVDAARFALLLVGLNFALALPLQSFDGVLWAYQRFDLQNGVDIPMVLARAGLTYWLIGAGHGLVALAWITLLTSLAGIAVKAALALRVEPGLRVGWARLNRDSAKGLFGYGIWYFLYSLIKTLGPQVILMIVASRLGTALVTPFAVASRLIGYANQFLIAGAGVLTPVATAMHARDEKERQQTLMLAGGRGSLALTLLFVSLFVFLGQPLIRLWMGPALAEVAFPLLLILTLGEVLPMSQQITVSILLGKGRPGILSGTSLLQVIASSIAGLILADQGHGLTGVCIAVAVPTALFRGVCPLIYACRALGVSVRTYVASALAPAILVAAGPALVLGWITSWWTPATWVELLGSGAVYAICFVLVAAIGLFGIQVWRDLMRRLVVGQAAVDTPAPALAEATKP